MKLHGEDSMSSPFSCMRFPDKVEIELEGTVFRYTRSDYPKMLDLNWRHLSL